VDGDAVDQRTVDFPVRSGSQYLGIDPHFDQAAGNVRGRKSGSAADRGELVIQQQDSHDRER
jgi:hypothetical protein